MSQLVLFGTSHKIAPIHIREKFSLSPFGITTVYNEMKAASGFKELVLLNTCNRVEMYTVINKENPVSNSIERFCRLTNIDYNLFQQHSFCRSGMDVVMHAFSVASGIESQMVGETEIFGQFKNAYHTAKNHETVGPVLNRMFQKSFQAAKWTRTFTDISQGQISIGNIAADLANRIFAKIDNVRILIIGGGEAAEKTLQAFSSRGTRDISITNRTFEKAQELAHRFHCRTIHFEDFPLLLDQFDIIVSSVSTQEPILYAPEFKAIMKKRQDTPLFLIDLGVPRNFDAGIADVPGAYLYNMNDLANIANENLKLRQAEIEKCRVILEEKARHVWKNIEENKAANRQAV